MTPSTIVRKPLDWYGDYLFYGNGTLKMREEKLIHRGTSLSAAGMLPGEIGILDSTEYGRSIDQLSCYAVPSKEVRDLHKITGDRIEDEPLVSKSEGHVSVNGNTLQIDLQSKNIYKDDLPLCVFEWYTTIETDQGAPYSEEQIKTIEDDSIGIALVDREPGSDSSRGKERISFYKVREDAQAALRALTDEEKKLITVWDDGPTLYDIDCDSEDEMHLS